MCPVGYARDPTLGAQRKITNWEREHLRETQQNAAEEGERGRGREDGTARAHS